MKFSKSVSFWLKFNRVYIYNQVRPRPRPRPDQDQDQNWAGQERLIQE